MSIGNTYRSRAICDNCIYSAYSCGMTICLLKDKAINSEDPKCENFINGYYRRRANSEINNRDR